jgi:uncharacterized protein (DUF2147 family)
MKKVFLLAGLALFSLNGLMAATGKAASHTAFTYTVEDNFLADDIVGVWMNDEKTIKVGIEKIGNKFYGKLVWLEKPNRPDGSPKLDEFNPDPSLRDVPFMGLRIMKDMEYKGKGIWGGGTLYDPEHGKTYGCKVTLEDYNTAYIRGYIGFALIGKSVRFDRQK